MLSAYRPSVPRVAVSSLGKETKIMFHEESLHDSALFVAGVSMRIGHS